MIVGLGSDMVDIRRIEQALARFGEKFERRVFTDAERAKADGRKGARHNSKAATLAKRFAAKEAFSKAVGTGFSHGVFMRDIEVVNLPTGQPTLRLAGNAAKAAARLIPDGKLLAIHLTLTDEYPLAKAMVIIDAVEN
jgi:holo-[acyl-carrier protein] synthase